MTSPEWRELIERSVAVEANAHWHSLYCAGVARLESLDDEGAAAVGC